jgi:2-dehydro-3-deoxy-D-arabinonate dehydratase
MSLVLTAAATGIMVTRDGEHRRLADGTTIDALLAAPDPMSRVAEWFAAGTTCEAVDDGDIRAPIGSQEVWAAGVTYLRSRVARVEESREAGGDAFYDHVYEADRPELFFKATPHRVVGHGGTVRIRSDSTWNVPEPEVTLVVSSGGTIIGYTAGNDMSSRSIEGENPLYLPQAKVYAQCASIGPRLVLSGEPPSRDTTIVMRISRAGDIVFEGQTTVAQIKRSFAELVEYLFRDNEFPAGVFLMTGTGIVPSDDFTLAGGDEIAITIDGVGTLVNRVGAGG